MEDIKYSVYVMYIECIKNGVIIVYDYYVSLNVIEGSLFIILDVVKDLGIRMCFCYEVFDRDGGNII